MVWATNSTRPPQRFASIAGAGGVAEQRDGLAVLAHGFQRIQRFLLVFPQLQLVGLQGASLLGGQIVLDLFKARVTAQEHAQLVLHGFGLSLHLPHGPAVHIPAKMDHSVLLEKVIVELVLRDQPGIVGSLVVDLDGNARRPVFQHKIGKTGVLADIVKRVLRIELSGLLGAKGIVKQVDEQILGRAAGCRPVFSHCCSPQSSQTSFSKIRFSKLPCSVAFFARTCSSSAAEQPRALAAA